MSLDPISNSLLEQWKKGALETASNVLTSPLKFRVVHVTGGGDEAWAAVELKADGAVGKNGKITVEFHPVEIGLLIDLKECRTLRITVGSCVSTSKVLSCR